MPAKRAAGGGAGAAQDSDAAKDSDTALDSVAAQDSDASKDSDVAAAKELLQIRAQRAIYADKALQIRNLLERIDAMERGRSVEKSNPDSPACLDQEDFFRRTKRQYPMGPIESFPDDDVIRLVERVVVGDGTITVEFKAGVKIDIDQDEVKEKT